MAYAACALVAAALFVAVYGRGSAGYDAVWALLWGRDLARGELPDLDPVSTAPTPHPLSNLVGAFLSPLGDDALPAFQLLIVLSAGGLAVACYALGRRLFTPLVGVVFAVVVLTRAQIVGEVLLASIDIPFLALVLAAAALEASRPRRGLPVLALLFAAGLLRPEAWLLSLGYAAYLRPRRAQLVRVGALALAAPLIWFGFDLIAEGDPLHSLHGTQALAETLDRPRGVSYAFSSAPTYLSLIVPPPLIWIGLAGWVASTWLFYERAVLPIALALSGLVCFLVLGATGLPVLTRYLLLPALMLALFAAVAVGGWTLVCGRRLKAGWSVAAAAATIWSVTATPADREDIRLVQEYVADTRAAQSSLHEVARHATAAPCAPLRVPHFRMRPLLAYWLDTEPEAIADGLVSDARHGTFFTPRSPEGVDAFFFDIPPPSPLDLRAPPGTQTPASTDRWQLHARCA